MGRHNLIYVMNGYSSSRMEGHRGHLRTESHLEGCHTRDITVLTGVFGGGAEVQTDSVCVWEEHVTRCTDRWNVVFEEKRRIGLWLE